MLDGTEVRKGLTGHLYKAPTGTALPDDTATPLPSPWVELGYLSDDALTQSQETNTEDVAAWQSLVPVRRDVTSQTVTFGFTLIQRNRETLQLAWGGGSFEAGTDAGDWIYTPPPASGAQDWAFVFEVLDGDIVDRYRLTRGSAELSGEVAYTKADPTGYQMTVTALAAGGEDSPWDLLSNDPALAA